MNEKEAMATVVAKIVVTRQMVTLAKARLLRLAQSESRTETLISSLLREHDAVMPERVILNPQVDPAPELAKAAQSFSWRLAASEALWELIHSSLLIQTTSDLAAPSPHLDWTTVYQGSGGHSSGWDFSEYTLPVPRTVCASRCAPDAFLVNPDLYLHDVDIPAMHPEVTRALRESVRCFRHDLFTAAAAMLGKAIEGAWLELGAALIHALPDSDQQYIARQRTDLESPVYGIGKKMGLIVALYERQDLYGDISSRSQITLQELRACAAWSDTVRDTRNTIHFGVEPSLPNTYEKVAALLLGAVPHLRSVYALVSAARTATNA